MKCHLGNKSGLGFFDFQLFLSTKCSRKETSSGRSGHNFSNKAFEATLELVKESRPPFLQILLILPILCVLSFLKMIYGINGVTILKMTYVRFTVEMV